jgi:hypothetical protein
MVGEYLGVDRPIPDGMGERNILRPLVAHAGRW